ncbi:glycerophosphoryl diester phosphodiesterase membrane domain-containing protein [bacterium]|nr:glycerophosphoryl diester phosphodiesterase membrane domain-containing protein [bacterium]
MPQLTLASVSRDLRNCWKSLALTDIVYKAAAFAVLTPLAGLLFSLFVGLSGRTVLADEDILYFLLGPVGWFALVVVGGAAVGILALELAALMMIACGTTEARRVGVLPALRFTASRALPVLNLAARVVVRVVIVAAPFLLAVGAVYLTLLTGHDINFYLAEKPPAFWVAVALAGVIGLALAAVLLRVLLGWALALPMLLFESVAARHALQASRTRMLGRRRMLARWIVGWAVASILLSTAGASVVGVLGRVLLPRVAGSLGLLVVSVGGLFVLWGAVNFVVTLAGAAVLAVLLGRAYRELGGQEALDAWSPEGGAEPDAGFRLTRKSLAGLALVAVALAAGAGILLFRSVRLDDRTEIAAHRGASAAAPENTLAAFERAIADGADWVELDVQEAADGTVVVIHDSDLKRIAGVDLKVWDATAAKLGTIDIGSRFSAEFADQTVPTLDQVLALCKGKIGVNIELKPYGHDRRLEEGVVEVVEAQGMASDIVVMSLKHDAARKVKALRPAWTVGLLTAVALGDLSELDADFLAVSSKLATRSFIRSAHNRGKKVHVWTVNDPVMMSIMMGRGADCIITDKPALARAVLEERKRMSSVERLMVWAATRIGVHPGGPVRGAGRGVPDPGHRDLVEDDGQSVPAVGIWFTGHVGAERGHVSAGGHRRDPSRPGVAGVYGGLRRGQEEHARRLRHHHGSHGRHRGPASRDHPLLHGAERASRSDQRLLGAALHRHSLHHGPRRCHVRPREHDPDPQPEVLCRRPRVVHELGEDGAHQVRGQERRRHHRLHGGPRHQRAARGPRHHGAGEP